MSIFQVGINQSLSSFDNTQRLMDNLTQQMSTGNKINSSSDDPVIWARSQQDTIAFKGLQTTNDGLAVIATSIRNADTAMGTMNTNIEQMKASLDAIIKNYPPFPPGSEARVKFLRSFKALRREIDELSFSSNNNNDDAAPKITADSAAVSRANERNAATGGKESNRTIPNHQVSTELTGLKIPDLSENATDEEINAAIKNLDDVKKTLNQRQSGFAANASRGDQFVESEPRMDKLSETHAEGIKSYDMTEIVAQNKSSDDKLILTMKSITSLTKDQSQLMELLR